MGRARAPLVPVGLALGSAALWTAAHPPWNAWPLAWVAWVPLLVAVARVGPLAAAAIGALFGWVFAIGVGGWLAGVLTLFFDTGAAGGWLAFLALSGLTFALPWGATGAVLSLLARRRALSLFATAAALALCGWARSRLGIGNPWVLPAYALPPGSIWLQAAELLGPYSGAAWLGLANAAFAAALHRPLRPRRFALQCAAAALLLAAVAAWGHARLARPAEAGEPTRVALLHDADRPGAPPGGSDPARRLARRLAWSAPAVADATPLLVWPELALPEPVGGPDDLPPALRELLERGPGEWLVGAAAARQRLDGTEQRNAVLLLRGGGIAGRHDKVELLAFAEDARGGLFLGAPPRPWLPGREIEPVRARVGALGVMICSEALQPDLSRHLARRGAGLLVNPSYDGWYPGDGAREQAFRITALRAVETRRWLVRSTVGGFTAAVDPGGRVRARRAPDQPGLLRAEVRLRAGETAYVRFGDSPFLLLAAAPLMAAAVSALRGRRR